LGITQGGFFVSAPETIATVHSDFLRDLKEVFADREVDLSPGLKELLFELWLRGRKVPPPEPGSVLPPVSALDALVGEVMSRGSVMTQALVNQSYWSTAPVPVMMDPSSGEVFGVNPQLRMTYRQIREDIELSSIDGYLWTPPSGREPPTKNDLSISHLQVYANGALAQVNTNFTVHTSYTHEEVVSGLFFPNRLDESSSVFIRNVTVVSDYY
jgi:hypothetical protein